MIAMVRNISDRVRLLQVNEYLQNEIRTELKFGSIIGDSPVLKKVLEQVALVAGTDASVLVTGESGTGKELVASAIHERSSYLILQVLVNLEQPDGPA